MTREEAVRAWETRAGVLSAGSLEQGAAFGVGRIDAVLEESAVVQFFLGGPDHSRGQPQIEVPLEKLVAAPEGW